MMNKLKAFLLLFLVATTTVAAYTPSESSNISILTVSSGREIYKIYGHSAIRFQDQEQGKDIVYNYGMFDFGAPHFILRYLQGRNFYLLGRETFRHFNHRYYVGGETVVQQTLNLSPDEVKILFDALQNNAQPQNREYLYNVLYDNCATRVYKIVEDNLAGGVTWSNECQEASFRDLLHHCNHIMPFSQMGIDMVFGTKADKSTTCMEQMFLPEKLMDGFAHASKVDSTPLVSQTTTLLKGGNIHNNNEIILFNMVLSLLFAFALYVRFKRMKWLRKLQITLYTIFGLISLVVCFIAFFSIHPTVLPNFNLIWINPLWLFFAALLMTTKRPKLIFQKILNIWSVSMALYLILGISGLFYLHYGFIYLLSTLVVISYRKLS